MNESSSGNACFFTEKKKLVIVTLISVLLRVPKLTSALQVAALNQMGKARHQFTLAVCQGSCQSCKGVKQKTKNMFILPCQNQEISKPQTTEDTELNHKGKYFREVRTVSILKITIFSE